MSPTERLPSLEGADDEEDIVSLDPSFFIDRSYEVTEFTFGSETVNLLCLQSASTDYDLTGQLVWPGALLLSSRFCRKVILTDHSDEVLEVIIRNIALQSTRGRTTAGLAAEKLEWGNSNHLQDILGKHPMGFDLILGADICFQKNSIPSLFDTVEKLLHSQGKKCRFLLSYISRAKSMDKMIENEAGQHEMQIREIAGTRTEITNHEGVIFEIKLK